MNKVELTATQPIPKKSQQIKTDKPRPHICTICTRAFARLEHLKRHERSHTNEKPFQCANCGRCFARRDLVLRHQQKLHSELGRRNSEDIIVLRNNTNANAPLTPMATINSKSPSNLSMISNNSSSNLNQNVTNQNSNGKKKDKPIFKSALFNLNTPPNSNSNSISFPVNHSPEKIDRYPRHQSYSAVSSNSYTKDYELPLNLDLNLDYFDYQLNHSPQTPSTQNLNQPVNSTDKKRKLDDLSPTEYPLVRSHSNPMPNHHMVIQNEHMDPINHSSVSSIPASNPTSIPNSIPSVGVIHESPFHRESISENNDWLQEIINTPYEPNFFEEPTDEISNLFKSRQSDLSKSFTDLNFHDIEMYLPMEMNDNHGQNQNHFQHDHQGQDHLNQNHQHQMSDQISFEVQPQSNNSGKPLNNEYAYINDELRHRILVVSNLSDLQFPSLDELNTYMKLYEKEFNKYFPFIHLPSLKNPMVDNNENIPLLLSMASIGALYSYHDSNTLLLFNLSKYHIQNFFEKEVTLDNLQFKKVPLMAHQCLVLHIFISMFLNEPPMIDITSRQMKSMVGLIKSTNFHKPLENFLIPPQPIDSNEDGRLVQNNFDYFIMCQSRIRTIFVFYMLQQFRTSTLLDLNILLNANNINCGSYSYENLWKCENSNQWYDELIDMGLLNQNKQMNSNFLIIKLSNNIDMKDLIDNLNHFKPTKIGFNNLLYLLIYCHERIQQSYCDLKTNFIQFDQINWRLKNHELKNVLKSWEMVYHFNGGSLIINESNNQLLNEHNEFKLILPLYYFAKIKIAVNLTPIIERIVYKDWENMNKYLNNLQQDFDGLKESIDYSLDIMNLWNQNISVVNDSKENNLRTPVFFVTCVFVSLLLISQFLYSIEDKDGKIGLGTTEKVLWLKCEQTLKKSEKILSLNSTSMEDYENYESIRKLIESNGNEKLIMNSLKLIKLSNKCLFLGVRILADAPIWPLAMGFAEALKNRANYISKI